MNTQVRATIRPSSHITGVSWCNTRNSWLARDGQRFLGRFVTFQDAATKVILNKVVQSYSKQSRMRRPA